MRFPFCSVQLIARFAAALLCSASALAHGPMPQRVTETVEVAAPPDIVWRRLGNFADASWHPGVVATKADRGNQVGSVRTLELKNGGRIVESLQARSETDRSLTYELVEPGPIPVSNYRATLAVKSGAAQTSVVEWTAGFMRADRSPKPEAGQTDSAAVAAVTELFRTGLNAVRSSAGKP